MKPALHHEAYLALRKAVHSHFDFREEIESRSLHCSHIERRVDLRLAQPIHNSTRMECDLVDSRVTITDHRDSTSTYKVY